MNSFTIIFLVALAFSFALEIWLTLRQTAFVVGHRNEVPESFQNSISIEAHQKAADYTVAKNRSGIFQSIIDVILLLVFTLGGVIGWISGFWSEFHLSPVSTGVAIILTVFVVSHLLEQPLAIYHTFSIEERFGFNKNTPGQFASDTGLHLILTVLIGGPLAALILWVMATTGWYWWMIAWAILMTFTLFMSWAYPTLIAPLFNKFTLLSDQELDKRIQTLLERCGFTSNGIFVMDGSRRSGHGNAYFTGLGSHKRIVFFDTLLKTLEHDEVEAVLAHELGHFKRKHVIKMLATSSVVSFVGLALLGWLVECEWFYTGLGIPEPSHAVALVLFILISPLFTIFLQPITAYFQRKHEFEADDFASIYTSPSALISALVKLYRDNANTLTPDPLYSAFHYSHPPASIRIANLSAKLENPVCHYSAHP